MIACASSNAYDREAQGVWVCGFESFFAKKTRRNQREFEGENLEDIHTQRETYTPKRMFAHVNLSTMQTKTNF